MDKTQIIIISAVMAIVAVRLYQKYIKKDNNKSGSQRKPTFGAYDPKSSKDEDYEPYSKK